MAFLCFKLSSGLLLLLLCCWRFYVLYIIKNNTTQPRPGQSRAGSSLPQAQENNGIYQVAGRVAAEPGRGGVQAGGRPCFF